MTDSGCGTSRRPAARVRAGLGKVRSGQSQKIGAGAAQFSLRAGLPTAATQVLVDTGPDLREQLIDADVGSGSTRSSIPIPTPTSTPRRRRCSLVLVICASTSAYGQRPRGRYRHAVFILPSSPPGSVYPPSGPHIVASGARRDVDGPGGAVSLSAFVVHHGDIAALAFASPTSPIRRISAPFRASAPHLEGLDLWIIDALRYAAHPSHSASTTRCPGSTASGRAARSSPTCIPTWITRCYARACRRTSSPRMTECG